jgi:UDP-N-acetylglucosamine 2-epimerase (non-hydrolysing)
VKVLFVVGARPNFMKVAPVIAAAGRWNAAPSPAVSLDCVLVHTGQHYDDVLSGVFFRQLGMPQPDEYLGVGSDSHARQTARLLESLETVLLRHEPDAVLVPGDVNSTAAASLVAAKLGVPVIHLEAGLRSGDRGMPEEINRIVADHLSALLLTTCADADDNLAHEGVAAERVVRVGNTMIDSLRLLRPQAMSTVVEARRRHGLGTGPFVLATLHRPTNVDDPEQLLRLMGVLAELSMEVPVLFPMHLRTRSRLAAMAAGPSASHRDLHLAEPLGYLEFVGLMASAAAVITDSGGVQEETTVLGVRCVTVRTTTERPVTVTEGTNRMVDPYDPAGILDAARQAVASGPVVPPPSIPLWDGRAGARVVEALVTWAATASD